MVKGLASFANAKLGGWHRVWIALSVLYLIVVFVLAIADFPNSVHPERVKESMPPEQAAAVTDYWYFRDPSDYSLGVSDYVFKLDNGYNIQITARSLENKLKNKKNENLREHEILVFGDKRLTILVPEDATDTSILNTLGLLETVGEINFDKDEFDVTTFILPEEEAERLTNEERFRLIKANVRARQMLAAYDDLKLIGKAYLNAEKKALFKYRLEHLGVCFLFWFFPVMFVYSMGWTLLWIYRGFKS
ncbi:MAG TPA: hypothetical protein EYQ41_03410 [Micavibrio sp.]|nr:hypothetical protein [Micavibrio sp.]